MGRWYGICSSQPDMVSLGHESETPASSGDPPLLESRNATMSRALDTARRAAATAVPMLLVGESGTGKHVLAAAIHEWSPRRTEPFTVVPRAALTEQRTKEKRRSSPTSTMPTYRTSGCKQRRGGPYSSKRSARWRRWSKPRCCVFSMHTGSKHATEANEWRPMSA